MVIRTEEDREMAEVLREQYAARSEHREQAVGRTVQLEQVRRRLVEIDAELNIEAELAAHRLERKLHGSGFPHARIAPLRRSHVEQRGAKQATTTPRQEQRGNRQPVLYRNLGQVLRVY